MDAIAWASLGCKYNNCTKCRMLGGILNYPHNYWNIIIPKPSPRKTKNFCRCGPIAGYVLNRLLNTWNMIKYEDWINDNGNGK